LPCPLVDGRVAVALPDPVRSEAAPGPAVVPVVEDAGVRSTVAGLSRMPPLPPAVAEPEALEA
jgi:hypothetical protein